MIRFYNGKTLCAGAVTENEVWTDGAKISYVGPPRTDIPVFARQIDLGGDLLMPGFKNAHTHSGMTFLRSLADDLPLRDWLFDMVFPREARLTPEALTAFAKVAFLEYIANGITACFDMYYYIDDFARLAADWGFRAVICEALSEDNDWGQIYDRYDRFNNFDPLVSYKLGFHAEYTASEDMLKFVSEAAHKFKAPVWSHNAETKAETEECVARHGLTPARYFDSLGLYDYGGGGFHCVWMTGEDMDVFQKRGCTAVLNACSNAKLASGVAPVGRFMERGLNLAVGTDGPASNNALDFFREMYFINVLAKLEQKDAAAGDPARILDAAVSAGARAMGLADCDDIAAGKQADMIVLDMKKPNMRPVNNIIKNIVYSGNPSNVRLTMIAGKILYEKGEFFVGEDPEKVYQEAEKYTKRIVNG